MARKVLDSNVGSADVETLMDEIIAQNPQINAQIEKVNNSNNAYLCEILRIYPYDDFAYVRVLNNNKTIFCRLSHEILSGGMSIDYLPSGVELVDNDNFNGKKYIQPSDDLYGIVIKVRWKDINDENVLLGYVNIHGHSNLKSSSEVGELSINSGSSSISVDNERVNIMTPHLFINGLPYDEPELKNYYNKKQTDLIIKSLLDSINNIGQEQDEETNFSYGELLDMTENYKDKSNENKYSLFRGDCWTINSNFESSASITSTSTKNFKVTGTFRTYQDMIGIYWYSQDLITHPYISYGNRSDYTGVVLEFDYTMSGCKDFNHQNNNTNPPSITIGTNDGAVYYVTMNRFITVDGTTGVKHFRLDFDNLTALAGNGYIDKDGNSHEWAEDTKLPVNDISYIMFIVIPENYDPNNDNPKQYHIMDNTDYDCEVTNIKVTNGHIRNEHINLTPHQYRLCEGYDDFYNMNPYRICKEMRKLGYTEWLDLYIGASHFYEKSGTVGDVIDTTDFNHTRTNKMVLDKTKPLNRAFSTWLDCYAKELKRNGTSKLIISVSMENLQCPDEWKQRDANGNFALTGWIPSTFFYSPCNDEVAPYMQSVSEACLDIVVSNGMRPILQMGEAWWWWNENDRPVDENQQPIIENWQPPCFYDDATRDKYRAEFGKDITEYTTSWVMTYDTQITSWLNKQLCNYSDKLREVVKGSKYENGLYMALFFPPSVLDDDRVPTIMHDVNYIKNAYSPSKLDVLQLEDYDWVTGLPQSPETKERDRSHHPKVYTIGQELGFSEDRLHYYGGFVQYPENAIEYWKLIKEAMETAVEKNFAEVYVWAGSQVRRDNKILGHDGYELVQHLLNE